MFGNVAHLVRAASGGDQQARALVDAIFKANFRTPQGWRNFFRDHVPGGDFTAMLADNGGNWTHQRFHALFIVAWALHPTEKGAYMLKLTQDECGTVQMALTWLESQGYASKRASSHLAGENAYSLARDWKFLKGYHELLVQIERPDDPDPYLFLKAEGHSMENVWEATLHTKSFVSKALTGKGETASKALNRYASRNDSCVELRAAENYSMAHEKLLASLDLSGKMVTARQLMTALMQAADPANPVAISPAGDIATLGAAILATHLPYLNGRRAQLQAAGIKFNDAAASDLRALACRMRDTAGTHSRQYFHERRLEPAELTLGLTSINQRLG